MDEVAAEIALDIPEGSCVNLGIGLPTKVASYLPIGREVVFHSENGIVGMGPAAEAGYEDPNLIDAGKSPVTLVTGGSFISHADSFALIRGGYIDVSVMGAFEVSVRGDLANWSKGYGLPAVGGAMDLAAGARSVRLIMTHNQKDGSPKLVTQCALPLTGIGVVSSVYTELGIFRVRSGHFEALGLAADIDFVRSKTAAPVKVSSTCETLPRRTVRSHLEKAPMPESEATG
jgi:3-oxoadipate CoA-transferase beta subunit